MNIDETIAELTRLRPFINPAANIVESIVLNVDRFASIEIKSIVDEGAVEHLSARVDEMDETIDRMTDEASIAGRRVMDLAEAVKTLLPIAPYAEVVKLKDRLSVIQKVENGEI